MLETAGLLESQKKNFIKSENDNPTEKILAKTTKTYFSSFFFQFDDRRIPQRAVRFLRILSLHTRFAKIGKSIAVMLNKLYTTLHAHLCHPLKLTECIHKSRFQPHWKKTLKREFKKPLSSYLNLPKENEFSPKNKFSDIQQIQPITTTSLF